MMLYALMALVCAGAMAWLTRPWWRRESAQAQARKRSNVAAYQSRVQEIELELTAGALDAETAAQLKEELAARVVDDTREAAPSLAAAPRSRLWLIALALPIFCIIWYVAAGSWRTQQLTEMAASDPARAQQEMVDGMVQRLATRLEQQPDDAEGWAMLGRSYGTLQRYADAASAYAKANELTGAQNPEWLVGEGEALALARDRDLLGRPQQLFNAALQLAPDHIGALWYAGLAAAQQQDYASTRARFEQLLQLELPPELREVVQQRMGELAQLTGQPAPTPAPQVATTSGVTLTLNISLAPELQKDLSSDQTLFVFAKAENGPPMPLAVQKLQGVKLPITVTLDDSMGMTPALKLSSAERWVVTARLTRSGGVQAQPGDLQGQITLGKAQATQLQSLRIDQKLP